MLVAVTGKTGTIGKHFPKSTYEFKNDLTKDFKAEIEFISRGKFSIIHSAGIVGESAVDKNIEYAFNVNVNATRILAEQVIGPSLEKFIFISTSHVYKRSSSILNENYEIDPLNNYAFQKRQAEIEIVKIFEDFPEKLIIARVFSVLDWGMPDFTLGGIVNKLILGKVNRISYGDDVRDFLTPKSTANIIHKLVGTQSAQGYINICTSNSTRVFDAIEIMLKQCGRKDLATKIMSGQSISPHIVGSNLKLSKILPKYNCDWSPDITYR